MGLEMRNEAANGWDLFDFPGVRTKMRILRGIDRSLDVMKIADICDNSGISRRTFYRHFDDKYGVLFWYCSYCASFFLSDIGRTISWETGYYHHLRLLYQERTVLCRAVGFSINEPFRDSLGSEERVQVLLETLAEGKGTEPDMNMRFLVQTYSRLECQMVYDWLRSNCAVDISQQAARMAAMVPPRLYEALKVEDFDPMT